MDADEVKISGPFKSIYLHALKLWAPEFVLSMNTWINSTAETERERGAEWGETRLEKSEKASCEWWARSACCHAEPQRRLAITEHWRKEMNTRAGIYLNICDLKVMSLIYRFLCKSTSSPGYESSLIIYSPSCHHRYMWLYFFSWTQMNNFILRSQRVIFFKMLIQKAQTSIIKVIKNDSSGLVDNV